MPGVRRTDRGVTELRRPTALERGAAGDAEPVDVAVPGAQVHLAAIGGDLGELGARANRRGPDLAQLRPATRARHAKQSPRAEEAAGPGGVAVVLFPDDPGARVGAVRRDRRGAGRVAEDERAVVHVGQGRLAAAVDPDLELAHVIGPADEDHVIVGAGGIPGGERRGVGEERRTVPLLGNGADLGQVLVGRVTATQVVPVQQVDHLALARLHHDVRIGAGAEREPGRSAGPEVAVALVEAGRVARAEEVLCLQRPVRLRLQPDHRLGQLARRTAARALRRGDAVTRGDEDPPGPVGHDPAAAVPDAALLVGYPDIVRPERGGAGAAHIPAGHVAVVGVVVTVRGERRVHPPVHQQQAGPLALGQCAERQVRVVGGVADDPLLERDRPGADVQPEQVPLPADLVDQPHLVHGVRRGVVLTSGVDVGEREIISAAPDDHGMAGPHNGVATAGRGGIEGGGFQPTVVGRVVATSGVQQTHSVVAARLPVGGAAPRIRPQAHAYLHI